MTPELGKFLATFSQELLNAADKIKAVAGYQIPDYIQQLMLWHSLRSLTLSVIAVVIITTAILIAIKVAYKAIKAIREDEDKPFTLEKAEKEERNAVIAMLSAFVAFALLITGILVIDMTWLKIWLTPKVWLVDYAISILK